MRILSRPHTLEKRYCEISCDRWCFYEPETKNVRVVGPATLGVAGTHGPSVNSGFNHPKVAGDIIVDHDCGAVQRHDEMARWCDFGYPHNSSRN